MGPPGSERKLNKVPVRFLPDDITIEAEVGHLLLDVALEAGVFIPASCGGSGGCGQCKVRVLEGSVDTEKIEKIHAAARAAGYVLACQSRITGAVTIEVPKAKVGRKVIPRDEAERMRRTAEPMESPVIPELNPMTLRVFMDPPIPDSEDNLSDYGRIVRALKVDHEIYPVAASLEVLKSIPRQVRQEKWKITACLQVEDIHTAKCDAKMFRINRVAPGHLILLQWLWPST